MSTTDAAQGGAVEGRGSLANQLFAAHAAYAVLEARAHDALMVALGINPEEPNQWPHEDFTLDHYDSSWELKSVDPAWTPTPDQIRATFALGFHRCWICYRDGTEAHYWKADNRPDSEWGCRRPRAALTPDPRTPEDPRE